jgi:hypothetical protein
MKEELMSNTIIDQYEFALMRYEELFLLVCGMPTVDSRLAIEMDVMSKIVTDYESCYFPADR